MNYYNEIKNELINNEINRKVKNFQRLSEYKRRLEIIFFYRLICMIQ